MFNINKFMRGMGGEGEKRVRRAAVRAVGKFGEHVIGKAQQLAPQRDGYLIDSATTENVKDTGKKITQRIGFNTSYAAAQHERMDYHHDKGQAKYLEKPMREEARKLKPFVEDEMKKAL